MNTTERRHSIVSLSFLLVLSIIFPLSSSIEATYEPPAHIDSNVMDILRSQRYTSVMVLLKDDSGIHYNPRLSRKDNFEIYRMKGKYFNQVENDVLSTLDPGDFILKYRFEAINGFSGYITKGGLDMLRSNPRVSSVVSTTVKASEHLDESVPLVGASDIWNLQIDGVNITGNETVCIIDSGVNSSHAALIGKVVGEKCYCDCGLFCGCCPNGNYEDNSSADDRGHGTMVSGIVAANYSILTGVAPDARIVSVKVLDSSGDLRSSDDLTKAIEYCINNSVSNVSAITMSFGTDELYSDHCGSSWTAWENVIDTAVSNGIFVIASAGNDADLSGISSPACIENVTSVGMSYDEGRAGNISWGAGMCIDTDPPIDYIACGGNRNNILDLLAPGIQICSTNYTGGTACDGGTSYSAPHVAGAAALLIQYERLKNNRTLTPYEIRDRFKDTGKLTYDGGEYSNTSGTNLTFPRIDVYAALFPIDVYDLHRLQASNTHNVFSFKIKNNYNNKTKDVSWSFDIGNGTMITSNTNISLPPGNTSFVFFEHNYSDGDIYTVEASASSGDVSDSETMTLSLGDIIAYDLEEIYTNGKERVFRFKILNNMDDTRMLNWTMNTWAESISASELTTLQPGNETFVYFHYNYTSECSDCLVYARAFNGTIWDNTNYIEVDVPA